jgi:hypothetical protein
MSGEYAGHGRTGTFSASKNCVQILAMGPCIMLKHEVMVADEWRDNGPQDLVTVFLCVQIAIVKIQLYSLSVAYACLYHNHTTNMVDSVHNVDINKPRVQCILKTFYRQSSVRLI